MDTRGTQAWSRTPVGSVAATAVLSAALLLATAPPAPAARVSVLYEAEIVTVVGTPFGLEVPLDTPASGFFTFDTSTPDADPGDPLQGEYPHATGGAFLCSFLDAEVRGSSTPHYQVDVGDQSDDDTFRIYDGPRSVGNEGGVMNMDGVDDEDIRLFVAITDDAFDNDALKDPFASYDFGFLGTPHTFSLEDDGGTMLLQFTGVTEPACGDPSGGGVSAGDALQVLKASVGSLSCYSCICDVDASGSTTAADALKTLKFAVGANILLRCGPCV